MEPAKKKKMLDRAIYDYLRKRNLHAAAEAFMAESSLDSAPLAIDVPGGFLSEWWSVFWEVFCERAETRTSEVAAACVQTHKNIPKEHEEQPQMQQLQTLQQNLEQSRDGHCPSVSSPINATTSKEHEQHLQVQHLQQQPEQRRDSKCPSGSSPMNATTSKEHQQQQMLQQQLERRTEGNCSLASSPRKATTSKKHQQEPQRVHSQMSQQQPQQRDGWSQGLNALPLEDSLKAYAQGNLGSIPNYADVDQLKLSISGLNVKAGQPPVNEGSIGLHNHGIQNSAERAARMEVDINALAGMDRNAPMLDKEEEEDEEGRSRVKKRTSDESKQTGNTANE